MKQEAFAQVAEHTFRHLHSLSLQWHLKKQMGNVLRSMDRGIASADTVVSYLFLYLLPSLIEAFVVFIIFYFHFGQPLLSAVIFVHLVLYIVITVQLTIWRKKFRKATNKHDNEFHDKATDSLINYETVKYFGNEVSISLRVLLWYYSTFIPLLPYYLLPDTVYTMPSLCILTISL